MKILLFSVGFLLLAQPILSFNVYYRGVKSPPSHVPTQQHIQHPQSPAHHRQQAPSQSHDLQDQDEHDEQEVPQAPQVVQSKPRAPTKSVAQVHDSDELPPAPVSKPRAPTKSIVQVHDADEQGPAPVEQHHGNKSPKSPTKSVVKQVTQEEQAPQAPTKSIKQVPEQKYHQVPATVHQRPVYSTKSKQNTKSAQVPERPQSPSKESRKIPQRRVQAEEDENDHQQGAAQAFNAPQAPVKEVQQRPVIIYVQELPQVVQDVKKPTFLASEAPRKTAQVPQGGRKTFRAPVDAVQQVHHPFAFVQ